MDSEVVVGGTFLFFSPFLFKNGFIFVFRIYETCLELLRLGVWRQCLKKFSFTNEIIEAI